MHVRNEMLSFRARKQRNGPRDDDEEKEGVEKEGKNVRQKGESSI